MYDFEWHTRLADKTTRSAEQVLAIVREFLPFESLLDVGCGSGLWLDTAAQLGCGTIQGIDGPWTDIGALEIPLSAFKVADLEKPFAMDRRYDCAISLEVAEHVAPAASDIFVDNLVAHADLIVFGAAIPFQGGFRHTNERWQSAWREMFSARGYEAFDPVRPLIWDSPDVHYWYKQNLLVYVRCTREDLVAAVTGFMAEKNIVGLPTDMIHPEKYESIASYRQIAFKPLARQLPAQLGAKMRDMVLMRT